MIFKNKLEQIRKEHQLTQEQMAEKLHIHQTTYSRYETGRRQPSAGLLKRIAEVFNQDMSGYVRPDDKMPGIKATTNTASPAQQWISVPIETLDMLIDGQEKIRKLVENMAKKPIH